MNRTVKALFWIQKKLESEKKTTLTPTTPKTQIKKFFKKYVPRARGGTPVKKNFFYIK